jgi:hypothetical protein
MSASIDGQRECLWVQAAHEEVRVAAGHRHGDDRAQQAAGKGRQAATAPQPVADGLVEPTAFRCEHPQGEQRDYLGQLPKGQAEYLSGQERPHQPDQERGHRDAHCGPDQHAAEQRLKSVA